MDTIVHKTCALLKTYPCVRNILTSALFLWQVHLGEKLQYLIYEQIVILRDSFSESIY